jgi:hypothetical protein
MTPINRWMLSCQGRVANIWYEQDYTVLSLNPTPAPQLRRTCPTSPCFATSVRSRAGLYVNQNDVPHGQDGKARADMIMPNARLNHGWTWR